MLLRLNNVPLFHKLNGIADEIFDDHFQFCRIQGKCIQFQNTNNNKDLEGVCKLPSVRHCERSEAICRKRDCFVAFSSSDRNFRFADTP